MRAPNVVLVLSDQHRAQATGYSGDPNASTPQLDALAATSARLEGAVATIPCCTPTRASIMTGQYPLTHGLFVNDVPLRPSGTSLAQAFASAGYDTAFIGKWHIDGHGRSAPIPRERRLGFEYWKALECTHSYFASKYYGDDDLPHVWDGYDAQAQTRDAQDYLRSRRETSPPFLLVLSWGPPHNPYEQVPERYRESRRPESLRLRANVPEDAAAAARRDLCGYYAHLSALDDLIGDLRDTVQEQGMADETLFVYTSDHGDMIGSQGQERKQRPWDESVRVPLLLSMPSVLGRVGRVFDDPVTSADLMPTLLGLCGLPVPGSVEGVDHSPCLRGERKCPVEGVLIECVQPSGEYRRALGGREYRGVRTRRHTYVRDLAGPWLLYDNVSDPYQQVNLLGTPEGSLLERELGSLLDRLLRLQGDTFASGATYLEQWGYTVDESGTIPFVP